jgi:hypothetical protein
VLLVFIGSCGRLLGSDDRLIAEAWWEGFIWVVCVGLRWEKRRAGMVTDDRDGWWNKEQQKRGDL